MEFPKKINEDLVKCELYHRLKLRAGNAITPYPELKEGNIRVDIAVIFKHEVVCVIEVKNYKNPDRGINMTGKQYQKYMSLSIPFFYCTGYDKIDETIDKVINLLLDINSNIMYT